MAVSRLLWGAVQAEESWEVLLVQLTTAAKGGVAQSRMVQLPTRQHHKYEDGCQERKWLC
jgi:hypothetical protein